MGFLAPSPPTPLPPPPPPAPPMMAGGSAQGAGAAARAAAAAAGGDWSGTLKTSPQGAPNPSTTGGGKSLFGS